MEYPNDKGWTYHSISAYARKTRTSVLNMCWQRRISDKNGIWHDMLPYVKKPFRRCLHTAVPKETFPDAMTSMDKVGGWNEEKWEGSNLAACMLIYTKAVLSNGRRRDPPLDLESILGIIVESVSWVTEGSLWDHEWIAETKGYHERKSHSGGTSPRHRSALPSAVGIVLVLSTD